MDPITLFTLGKTLISAGPALMRGIGSLFGGETEAVTKQVADMVDKVKDLPLDKAGATMQTMLGTLPPEKLAKLQSIQADLEIQMARINAAREAERLQAETAQTSEDQQTRRAEVQSNDRYTRRTRPKLARLSMYSALIYLLFCGVIFPLIVAAYDSISALPGVDWSILMAIYAPALAYNGVRSADKWRQKNA